MKALNQIFRPAQFTGWHMLGVIGLFFGTIISVNMVLAFNAATTWTGLMVKNTYVESQNFNGRIEALSHQKDLGWQVDIHPSSDELRVDFLTQDGELVELDVLTGLLGRPVHEGADQKLSFQLVGETYVAPVELPVGQWQVQLTAISKRQDRFVKTLRFVIPQ